MLIEIVGASGVGKSTISRLIQLKLTKCGYKVITTRDLILKSSNISAKLPESVINFLIMIYLLRYSVTYFSNSRGLISYIFQGIKSCSISTIDFFNRLRSIIRLTGEAQFITQFRNSYHFILNDEGIIGGLHAVAVSTAEPPNPDLVNRYFKCISKNELAIPGAIIFLEVQDTVLCERVVARIDPPIRGATREILCRFVLNAQKSFKSLTSLPNCCELANVPLLRINNEGVSGIDSENVINCVNFVMEIYGSPNLLQC